MENLLNPDIFTKTLDDLPIGIGVFQVPDPTDLKSVKYIFMNKLILHEMRKEKEEVFGNLIVNVAPEAFEHETGLKVIETYRDVSVNGESVNLGIVEYSNVEVAGTYDCSVHHIKDNYVYVMLRNVTELEQSRKELAEINKNLENRAKERTEELELKNKDLEQFAYISSHDLQEPLRTISNFIQVIQEDYESVLDKDVLKFLDAISKSAERMRTLIYALYDFSRLGHNNKPSEVDSKKIVTDVIEDLNQLIELKNANVSISELPKLMAFETELRQLFQNLITNAIKFQKANQTPKIKITAKERDDHYQFSIYDNGIGIALKDIDRIFNIFQRLHSVKVYEGSGTGLAYCKKIAQLHQGTIWVESEVNKGSVFHFTISKNLNP